MTESSGNRPKDTLLGSGSLYTLATIAPVIVTLLITPLVTRALGPEGYGVIGVGISLYQFGSILLGVGLSASITRHAIISRSGVRGAVALVFVGTAISVVLAIVAGALLPVWGRAALADDSLSVAILIWPVISSAALSAHALCQSVYRAVLRVRTFVALGVLSSFAGPGLGYLFIATTGPSPSVYLAGLAAGHSLAAMAAIGALPRTDRTAFSAAEIRENLRIGLPTVPHSIASAFLIGCLVIVAQHIDGIAAAGRVQLALFLGSAPLLVLGAFNNSWAPMVYRSSRAERPALLTQSMRAISVLVFVLVAGFCALVEPVARFIAGPQIFDRGMVDAALIAAVATPMMALYLVNMHLVFLSGRTGAIAVTSPLSFLIAILLATAVRGLGVTALWGFAIGLPLFQLSQWLMSIRLRRASGHPAPSIMSATPALALAVAVPLLYAVVQPEIWVGALVTVAVAVALVYANREALRYAR